jgi:hypothetical protein
VRIVDRYYDGAGRSSRRRHRLLARDWMRRTFGRRTAVYFWTVYVLALLAVLDFTPQNWRFVEGALFGATAIVVLLLPDLVLPDHIARWQRGAWGEQSTARALKPLHKQGWLIRHDLATGYANTNRDHIAVGPAVYLLDSKLLKDKVWLEENRLHVRRVDASQDEYSVPAPTQKMTAAAQALKRDLDAAVGFPVAVYPVVVIWGHFAAGDQWDGSVAYVDGDKIANWLARRPVDLRDARKRLVVQNWLRALPQA